MSTPGKVTTLKVSPAKLRAILDNFDKSTKESSPSPDAKPDLPPAVAATSAAAATDGASDSNPATPGASTPMAPPGKKGVKRAAPSALGEPRDRKKPGPKKKRLDDGESRADRSHKLGPKANQGAINAGLRALDRSGKPCRRWAKGSFTLKSFTGVTWEIARWTTPARASADDADAAEKTGVAEPAKDVAEKKALATEDKEGEGEKDKEEKEEGKRDDEDVEMKDAPGSLATNSPLRPAIAAA
ncbi:hypothetical protein TD95_002037 [Thielaviopsis punctulata]|uniref:Uncharacterized protein n=1 Tax=Thielaviopsis punctulata TaxID=72032 RepID=A0A0F4ZGC0_9PEZI|nr:hypothetical protein TD95_002037 [Thielaviopsis punctulata]